MLKKLLYRKIVVATSILVIMLMLYLIPTNKDNIELNTQVEYIYSNDLGVIYLLDSNNYLSRTKISINNKSIIDKATDLIDGLTINGMKHDIIPNGFNPILPIGTKILDIKIDNNILTVNFSYEFNNIKKEYEEKAIEALIYTLTSIDGIDKIKIYVEGKELTNLPNSKKKIPSILDKNYGINKEYDIATIQNIDSYTVYYVFNYNDSVYYTPVTKYINNENQDKVKVIINELSTSLTYESNLMSYLDNNIKLLNYEMDDDTIKLNFNDLILSDITNNVILEEVIYTIGLSLCDEFAVQSVVFLVNGREISTFNEKILD